MTYKIPKLSDVEPEDSKIRHPKAGLQSMVELYIEEFPGARSRDIAEALCAPIQSLNQALHRLSLAERIHRVKPPHDRRAVWMPGPAPDSPTHAAGHPKQTTVTDWPRNCRATQNTWWAALVWTPK